MMAARRTDGQREVLLSTKEGMIIRFAEDEVRPMGRMAAGVRGIDLEEGDQVIAAEVVAGRRERCSPSRRAATASDAARGVSAHRARRQGHHRHQDWRAQRLGGGDAAQVRAGDDMLVVTTKGKMIRVHADEVTSQGRNTMGVRIIDLDADDQVGSIARVEAEQTPAAETHPRSPAGRGARRGGRGRDRGLFCFPSPRLDAVQVTPRRKPCWT